MEYLYIICAGILLFFSISILTKRRKALSEKIFSFWIVLLMATVFSFFLYAKGLAGRYPLVISLTCDTHLLHGALLYLYIRSFTESSFRLSRKHLLHLLPLLLQVGSKLYLNFGAGVMDCYRTGGCAEEENAFVIGSYIYKYLVLGAYILASWQVFLKQRRRTSLPREIMRSQWVKQILLGTTFLYSGILLIQVGRILFPELFWERMLLGNILATLFIFIFLYIGNSYTYLFVLPSKKRFINLSESFNIAECRQHPGEITLAQIFSKVEECMLKQQPYQRGGITLKDIAMMIDESPLQVSQAINQMSGQNFSEYLNSFRVEKLKELLDDPANWNFKIMALATECGFTSKTSLIRIFKQQAGLTPGEYLENARAAYDDVDIRNTAMG